MPGSSARAAVKARGLRAEGLGQLLHAELTPRRVAGPPGRRGDLSHQVAAGERPRGAARGPGGIRDRRDRAGRRYITWRGPGTGVEQRRHVLRRPRDPRREGPRAGLGRGKTLIEVLGCSLCVEWESGLQSVINEEPVLSRDTSVSVSSDPAVMVGKAARPGKVDLGS